MNAARKPVDEGNDDKDTKCPKCKMVFLTEAGLALHRRFFHKEQA